MPRAIMGNLKNPCGTLDNVNPPSYLLPHQFSIMQNWKMSGGLIIKRGGTVAVGSALAGTGAVQGLWIAYRADGTETPVRYAMRSGTIYSTTASPWTWTTTGITGWSTSKWASAAVYQGKIFFCNGDTTSPQYSTLSAPATIGSWGPASQAPVWVIEFGNRLYCGTASGRIYMSDIGDPLTWQSQNFYSFPDDQAGGSALMALAMEKGILLYGPDFMGTLTGYSELDHEFQPWPKRGALLSRRCVFSVGGAGVSLSSSGPDFFDGFSVPRSMDPQTEVDFSSADLTDPNMLWGERVSPTSFRIFFQNRGEKTQTAYPTAMVASNFASIAVNSNAILNRVVAASAPSVVSHYYEYNMVANSWTGPHTGAYSCGAWENMLHGDRQTFWVGHASSGKILKTDQDVYTDDGVPYECVLRTNSFGLDPFKIYRVTKCEVMCNSADDRVAGMRVRLIYDEQPDVDAESGDIDISKVGAYEGMESPVDLKAVDRGGYCVVPFVFETAASGRSPQIEIRELSDRPRVIRGIAIEYEEVI